MISDEDNKTLITLAKELEEVFESQQENYDFDTFPSDSINWVKV